MLNVNEFVKEVHANSVAHGWWESNRRTDEILALIHSELSEALEEYRAGRSFLWFKMDADCSDCSGHGNPDSISNCCVAEHCPHVNKPEGIAVELIDACIRIFDYLGHVRCKIDRVETIDDLIRWVPESEKKLIDMDTIPSFVAYLHAGVSSAYMKLDDEDCNKHIAHLIGVAAATLYYVKKNGNDPEELITMKHRYNLTRPYKHGNKVC